MSLTEKYTRHDSMRIIKSGFRHITEAQKIKFSVSCTTHGMDWHQDRPCYQASCKANGGKDSQKAKEEIPIHRRMVKNMGIGDFEELANPVDESRRQFRTPFTDNA